MNIQERLKHELKAVLLVTLFFAAWLGVYMALKVLILEATRSASAVFPPC